MVDLKKINESNQKLFLLIKTAIEREVASQEIYKEALKYCGDPILHEVIEKLYHEEIMHEERLQKIYKKLRRDLDEDGKPLPGRKE